MTPDNLKDIRLKAGMSRQKLSLLLGYTANYLYLLETGRKPITQTLLDKLSNITELGHLRPKEVRSPLTTYNSPDDSAPDRASDRASADHAALVSMQKDITEIRHKIDTLFDLLGGVLRKGFTASETNDADNNKTA